MLVGQKENRSHGLFHIWSKKQLISIPLQLPMNLANGNISEMSLGEFLSSCAALN